MPLFSVDTHHDAGRLRRGRLRPRRRARVHERARVPRPRRRAGPGRAPAPRAPDRGRRWALRVQPRADGRLRRRVRDRRRRGGRRRDHRGRSARGSASGRTGREGVLRELATIPGVYVPVDVRRRLRRPVHRRGPAALRRRARAGRQAHGRRSRRVAVPEAASSCRSIEVVHDRLNVEVFRGCTRGLPVLPGRDDHPPGARAARGAGAHDGARRPAPHRVRRGRAHVAVDRRLLRDRRPRRRPRERAGGLRQRRACRCRRCGSTRSPSASPARSRRCAAPGSRSRPRAARGASAR